MLSYEDREKQIELEMNKFPAIFGLRAFPGYKFRISKRASYFGGVDGTTLYLYTQRYVVGKETNLESEKDVWLDFAKATPDELRNQIVQL